MKHLCSLGLMSGTSLDGLDLCIVEFDNTMGSWEYSVVDATTISYPALLKQQLVNCVGFTAEDFVYFDIKYGRFLGDAAREFIAKNSVKPSVIASHGHTIFHQPWRGMTKQIGSGAEIAAITGLTTVCDFRSLDVALGGHGAPLVPMGDELLFSNYDYCLNLGGFANISTSNGHRRIAYDICPVNIVMNQLAQQLGHEFDRGGELARSGAIIDTLLHELNGLPFYALPAPKSLGREWVEKSVLPLLSREHYSTNHILRTFVEHCATQLSRCVTPGKTVLTTGGGAYNSYLMERFAAVSGASITIPDDTTVQFKEAIIFALLGLLRVNNHVNTLSPVTGAKRNSAGGCVYEGSSLD